MPMSFIGYLIVLIFVAGSALFGFDVLTAPQRGTHAVGAPIGTLLDKLARRIADEPAMQHEGKPGTLTPIYPTHPGQKAVRAVTPANPATRAETENANKTKLTETTGAVSGENEVAHASTPVKVEPALVAHPAVGHCNVPACAATYRSFRAADCTYQPYDGPRRACVALRSADHAKDRVPESTVVHAAARRQILPWQNDYDANAVGHDRTDAPDAPPASIVVIERPHW